MYKRPKQLGFLQFAWAVFSAAVDYNDAKRAIGDFEWQVMVERDRIHREAEALKMQAKITTSAQELASLTARLSELETELQLLEKALDDLYVMYKIKKPVKWVQYAGLAAGVGLVLLIFKK